MKSLYNWFGGRALLNNDLEAMQEQLFQQASLHYNRGAYLISGGAVTSAGVGLYNVAEALIVVNNQLVLMPAQTSVVLTATTVVVQTTDVTLYPRPFAIWSSVLPGVRKTVAQIRELSTVTAGSGQYLKITPNGFMRTFADAQRDITNLVDEIKYYTGASTNFDANGAGLGNFKGWQICNGTNGYPDYTGRFLVAKKTGDINFATANQIGGAKSVTLTTLNLPPHSHTIQDDSNAHTHQHKFPGTKMVGENSLGNGESAADDDINNAFDNNTGSTSGNHSHGGVTGDTGSGNAFSVLNPYYVVECVIVWVGNSQYHGSI
jgi:microcystin-dependent protein